MMAKQETKEEDHHVIWKSPLIKIVNDDIQIEAQTGIIWLNGHVIYKNGHYFDVDGSHYGS